MSRQSQNTASANEPISLFSFRSALLAVGISLAVMLCLGWLSSIVIGLSTANVIGSELLVFGLGTTFCAIVYWFHRRFGAWADIPFGIAFAGLFIAASVSQHGIVKFAIDATIILLLLLGGVMSLSFLIHRGEERFCANCRYRVAPKPSQPPDCPECGADWQADDAFVLGSPQGWSRQCVLGLAIFAAGLLDRRHEPRL